MPEVLAFDGTCHRYHPCSLATLTVGDLGSLSVDETFAFLVQAAEQAVELQDVMPPPPPKPVEAPIEVEAE